MITEVSPEVVPRRTWTPNSLRWLIGFTASLSCTEIFYVAVGWAAVQITSPLNVSMVLLASAVPQALLLLLGGVLVDRLDPRRVAVVADSARFVLMSLAALAALTGNLDVAELVVLSLAYGAADGFFLPAADSMPVFLVARSELVRVQGMQMVGFRLAVVLGGPLAGWLIVTGSASASFWAGAGLLAVSVATLATTRLVRPVRDAAELVEPAAALGRWRELTEGIRTVAANPTSRTLLLVYAAVQLGFTGPTISGLPMLSRASGWGSTGVGWTLGAYGVGGILGAGLLALRPAVRRPALLVALCATVMGVSVGSIGAASVLVDGLGVTWAVLAALVAGICSGPFSTLCNAHLLRSAPEGQAGRVMAVVSLAAFTAMPVSLAITGLLAQTSGPSAPFIAGGAAMLTGGLLTLVSRAVRRPAGTDVLA